MPFSYIPVRADAELPGDMEQPAFDAKRHIIAFGFSNLREPVTQCEQAVLKGGLCGHGLESSLSRHRSRAVFCQYLPRSAALTVQFV
jgi:hypothetical protein